MVLLYHNPPIQLDNCTDMLLAMTYTYDDI
jgi:hypothetical protein